MSKARIERALVFAGALVALGALARPAGAQGLQFFAVTPCRTVDTRTGNGGIITAAVLRQFAMKGTCQIPVTAKAISLNCTIVSPSVTGFFSLWPAGGPFPTVATINFDAGEPALANGAIVPLGAGSPDLSVAYGTALSAGTLHAVIDVTGYFQ
jgi:hypothetical protein